MRRSTWAVASPLAVVALGFATALGFRPLLREWAWIPLALVYWGATFAFAYRGLGKRGIARLFARPQKSVLWVALCCVAGCIPLPILLMNLGLLASPGLVALWLAFALVNPFFEEIFWRGYLLTALPFSKKVSVLYATLLFVASHPLLWGVFSIANRSPMMVASLLLMGIVWSVAYLKTGSLRWCVASHFLVDVFNLAVFVFLNLYVPPGL